LLTKKWHGSDRARGTHSPICLDLSAA
jgi:hypothetical protein